MSKKPKGRVASLKQRYSDIPNFIFDFFIKNDPSDNNKYLEWSISRMNKKPSIFRSEKSFNHPYVESIVESVNLFHKHQNRMTGTNVYCAYRKWYGYIPASFRYRRFNVIKNSGYGDFQSPTYEILHSKDINTYNINPIDMAKLINIVITDNPTDKELRSERVEVRNDDMVAIIVPLTERASCKYGSGTKWCTAAKQHNHFGSYNGRNEGLIYFDFKKTGKHLPSHILSNKRLALHWRINRYGRITSNWYDAVDHICSGKHVNDWFNLYAITYTEGTSDQREGNAFYFSRGIRKTVKTCILSSEKLNRFQRICLRLGKY